MRQWFRGRLFLAQLTSFRSCENYTRILKVSGQQLNRFYDKHSHPMLRDEAYLKDCIFNWDTQSNVFLLLEKS